MFRLKTIDNKIKGYRCWTANFQFKNLWVLFTYSHDKLGREVTWCWCSLELEGLFVIVGGSCSGVAEIDNDSSANLLYWVSDISKSTR